jgi:hypothetical protein
MGLSLAQCKALGISHLHPGSPAARPDVVARATEPASRMNKGETAYSKHLETLRRAGEIARWDFEPEKFRLADNCYLKIDFRVVLPDGVVEFHDVKGRKGDGPFVEEDAMLKYRFVAEHHPYRFFLVWPAKGGGWRSKRIGRQPKGDD